MSDQSVVLFGEVLFDCFPGHDPVLGGAPFNVAWHLHGFGEHPVLVSAVGDDEPGQNILDKLQTWGMDTRSVVTLAGHATGVVNVTLEGAEPAYAIEPDRAYDHIPDTAIGRLAPDSVCLLYQGTLALRNEESRRTLTGWRSHYAGPVFMDLNLRDPWWEPGMTLEWLTGIHTLKLNLNELWQLFGDSGLEHSGDWRQLAIAVRQHYNLVNILVTRGAEGASALDSEATWHDISAPSLAQPAVDAVGAGDAFSAISVLGLKRGWDWPTILERAQQFASFIVTQRGAVCSDPATYRDFKALWALNPPE